MPGSGVGKSGWSRFRAGNAVGGVTQCVLWFVEDVGDEGEEEKEFISYNINIDIHYGVKSNR